MCGGGIVGEILHPVIDLATAYFGGPLAEGALQTGEGLAKGESFGKALGQGAEAGIGTFAGEEVGGALSNAAGLTPGGNSLTDLLGQTSGQGGWTGAGTVLDQFTSAPDTISNMFSSSTSPTSLTPSTPGSPSVSTPATGSGGVAGGGGPGGSAASNAAPSGLATIDSSGDLISGGDTSLAANSGIGSSPISLNPQAVNSSGSLIGTPDTTNSSSAPGASVRDQFSTGLGGPPSLNTSGIDSFLSANPTGAGGLPSNSDLSSSVFNNESASFNSGTPSVPESSVGHVFDGTSVPGQTGGSPVGGATVDSSGNLISGGTSSPAAASGFSGAASGASTPSSLSNLLKDPSMANLGKMLAANPSADISALGLGADALQNNKLAKGQKQLLQEASSMQTQSAQLENYLQTGTLPPGVQQSINQAADAQKAAITSRYAAQGGTGSSAMQQDLAAVDSWAQGQGAQTAMGLLQQGISESGLSAGLYQDIANTALRQDESLGSAIAAFASSLGGGGGKNISLKLA